MIIKTDNTIQEGKFYCVRTEVDRKIYFDSQEEYNTFLSSLPVTEPKKENIAIEILKNSTPEEIQQIKNLLK